MTAAVERKGTAHALIAAMVFHPGAQRLFKGLRKAIAASEPSPPCSGPGNTIWTSEELSERREAEALCVGCPVVTECGQYADTGKEKFGVWGGQDRTPRPGPRRKAQK